MGEWMRLGEIAGGGRECGRTEEMEGEEEEGGIREQGGRQGIRVKEGMHHQRQPGPSHAHAPSS